MSYMVTSGINCRRLLALINFQLSFKLSKIIFHDKRLAIMYCNKLHAWWSTKSQLVTLLSSLLHAGGTDFRLYDGSDLKMYLLMRWYGPDAFAVVRPTGFTCWISFALIFSFMYC